MDSKEVIKSQYRATLEMLGSTVSKCPDTLWDDSTYKNRFWHVAYHALFFAHLYLHEREKEFVAWKRHRKEYQFLGPLPWPPHTKPRIGESYTKEEVLEYLALCREEVEARVPSLDLGAESGFSWLPFTKLELQFYNIRHIQHHTGELIGRLRSREDIPVRWIAMKGLD
ncbi:MAG: DinB family protein [Candidatus Hydrogenedentales bacterium]